MNAATEASSTHDCPVCGFPDLREAPRSPSGGGSYEMCPACGFQFGVDDDDRHIAFTSWRKDWIARGMPWTSQGISAPPHWNPEQLLLRVS